MTLDRFKHAVTTVEELESLIGSPSELVIRKQLAELAMLERRLAVHQGFYQVN